jgi:hypothetical protein
LAGFLAAFALAAGVVLGWPNDKKKKNSVGNVLLDDSLRKTPMWVAYDE